MAGVITALTSSYSPRGSSSITMLSNTIEMRDAYNALGIGKKAWEVGYIERFQPSLVESLTSWFSSIKLNFEQVKRTSYLLKYCGYPMTSRNGARALALVRGG